jgi:thiazole/oxazole-forming peptide maturase SagD family component
MEDSDKPLAVAFGWSRDAETMTFLGAAGYTDVTASHGLVRDFLRECTGHQRLDEIAEKLGHDLSAVREIANALEQEGLISDSRRQFRLLHRLSANPQPYGTSAESADIAALLAESRRLRTSTVGISLPRSRSGDAGRNRTCRRFARVPLDAEALGSLLASMYGAFDTSVPVPSAGAVYPLALSVLIMDPGETVDAGVYDYFPVSHTLANHRPLPARELLVRAFDSYDFVSEPAAVIVVAARVDLLSRKYGNRAYRYVLLEAGHVAQNAQIWAARHSLGVWEFGGYRDELLAEALGLDPAHAVLIALAVGKPAHDPTESPDEDHLRTRAALRDSVLGEVIEWVSATGHPGTPALPAYSAAAKYRAHGPFHDQTFGSGVGLTSAEAEVKALAEALERHMSGRIRVDIEARADALIEPYVAPEAIAPMSAAQRDALGLESFAPAVPWQWVRGWRTASKSPCLVPIDYVYYPLDTTPWRRRPAYRASSSGVAAHKSDDEILRRGLLELIERDAICLTWGAKRTPAKLDPRLMSAYVQARRAYWATEDYALDLLDLSLDSAPIVLAVIRSERNDRPIFAAGAAADFSLTGATTKAIGEAETLMAHWRSEQVSPLHDAESVLSPLDHGRYYLAREHLRSLEWLFEGPCSASRWSDTRLDELVERFDPIVVALCSASECPLAVQRVLSTELIPITFGLGADIQSHPRFKALGLRWAWDGTSPPHFFA